VLLPLWISLALLVVLTTGAAFHLFLRARNLWRTLKEVGDASEPTLERVNAAADRLERNSDALGGASPRLEESLERLRRSLAKLSILLAAVQDVRDAYARLAVVYPRK
jgi:ABC-type transporter Mla subunit MlaD